MFFNPARMKGLTDDVYFPISASLGGNSSAQGTRGEPIIVDQRPRYEAVRIKHFDEDDNDNGFKDSNGYYKAFQVSMWFNEDMAESEVRIDPKDEVFEDGRHLLCYPIGVTHDSPTESDNGFWLLRKILADDSGKLDVVEITGTGGVTAPDLMPVTNPCVWDAKILKLDPRQDDQDCDRFDDDEAEECYVFSMTWRASDVLINTEVLHKGERYLAKHVGTFGIGEGTKKPIYVIKNEEYRKLLRFKLTEDLDKGEVAAAVHRYWEDGEFHDGQQIYVQDTTGNYWGYAGYMGYCTQAPELGVYEIVEIQRSASIILCQANEDMGETIAQEIDADVVFQYQGNTPDDSVQTCHDPEDMFKSLKTNDYFFAVWDDENNYYVVLSTGRIPTHRYGYALGEWVKGVDGGCHHVNVKPCDCEGTQTEDVTLTVYFEKRQWSAPNVESGNVIPIHYNEELGIWTCPVQDDFIGCIKLKDCSSDLPQGWRYCDGENSTPDTVARTVRGADPSGTPDCGDVGGSDQLTGFGVTSAQVVSCGTGEPPACDDALLGEGDSFILCQDLCVGSQVVTQGGDPVSEENPIDITNSFIKLFYIIRYDNSFVAD